MNKSKSSEGKGIKEFRIETNHLKTLMLGIKFGRLIGVGLHIDKIYPLLKTYEPKITR